VVCVNKSCIGGVRALVVLQRALAATSSRTPSKFTGYTAHSLV
jgi:hypothetical protein